VKTDEKNWYCGDAAVAYANVCDHSIRVNGQGTVAYGGFGSELEVGVKFQGNPTSTTWSCGFRFGT
jgi:carbon monoxide dehydrogenase subunit G